MAQNGGVNDPCDWRGKTGALHLGFGKAIMLDQVGQTSHEFAQADGDAMEVCDALEEDGSRQHATKQNEPHERPSLLHVFDLKPAG